MGAKPPVVSRLSRSLVSPYNFRSLFHPARSVAYLAMYKTRDPPPLVAAPQLELGRVVFIWTWIDSIGSIRKGGSWQITFLPFDIITEAKARILFRTTNFERIRASLETRLGVGNGVNGRENASLNAHIKVGNAAQVFVIVIKVTISGKHDAPVVPVV